MKWFSSCVFWLVVLVPVLDAHAAPSCPNRPSGATTVADIRFDTSNGEGQLWELYPGAGYISNPSGAPGSPTNASTSKLGAFDITGGQQTIWPKPGNQQPLTNLYQCLVFKMAPGFVGQRTANKLVFSADQDFPYNSVGSNGFFGLAGVQPYPPTTFTFYFGHNSGNLDNSHTCSLDLGLVCTPNITATAIAVDQWTTLETYMIGSSTPTARNGTVKWWVNGTLNGSYTNLNYASIVNQWQINHTWDGGGALQCSGPSSRQCGVDQIYYFDHVILASVGGVGGGGGGDTTPPSQVTGLTVGSITSSSATLSWAPASDNVGVVGYQIETSVGAGSTSFGNTRTSSTASFPLTSLIAGTVYNARIKAYDLAGNVSSSYSSTATWTTTAGLSLPSMTTMDADTTGANVAWSGSPGSIRVNTDTLNIVEPMTAFPVTSATIARVQSASTVGSGASIGKAFASSNTAGSLLFLRYAGAPSSVTISTCSDTRGNTWTSIPNATGGGGGHQAMRYAKNSLAGANTVTCTLTGAATSSLLDIFEYSGVDTTAPLMQSKLTAQVDPGTGANAISSGSVTTTNNGELILGATLQVGQTVYDAATQFSGTQGANGWYYKDSSGANLTWSGSYWYGSGYLGLWDSGGHPGNPLNAVRRWVAPADGSVRITGTASNSSGCGGSSNGDNLTITKNGATLWSQLVPGSGSYPFDISSTAVATDYFDFIINNNGAETCDSVNFAPTITLGTASGSGGTTTTAGSGFTIRHASVSDSPIEDQIQSSAGPIAATFTGADAANDYITSIATFRPAAAGAIRYARVWPIGTTFVCMYPRDSSGNENTVSPGYLCDTVTGIADTTPPVRSSPLPSGTLASGTTSTTISIATNEVSICKYGVSAGIAYGSIANTMAQGASGLAHSATVSGLSNGNTYTYYVRCQDASTNANASDTTISFSVASSATDTTAPNQITGLVCEALNATQIACTWTPGTDDVAVTGYEIYVGQESVTPSLAGTSTIPSHTLSSLTAESFYLIKVRAKDAVGNLGTFSNTTVILTPRSDVTRPGDVVGLAVTAVDFATLDVMWTAGTDDVGVVSSAIEQCTGIGCTDFRLVATVYVGTSVRLSGLSPMTTYQFRAKHADLSGNVSATYSPIALGTTLAVPTGTVTASCLCKHQR